MLLIKALGWVPGCMISVNSFCLRCRFGSEFLRDILRQARTLKGFLSCVVIIGTYNSFCNTNRVKKMALSNTDDA